VKSNAGNGGAVHQPTSRKLSYSGGREKKIRGDEGQNTQSTVRPVRTCHKFNRRSTRCSSAKKTNLSRAAGRRRRKKRKKKSQMTLFMEPKEKKGTNRATKGAASPDQNQPAKKKTANHRGTN